MHYSLKQVLMMGSVIAFVGTSACSTIEATASLDGSDDSVTQSASGGDILRTMAHDSEAGGE
jgi:hypothetical protein